MSETTISSRSMGSGAIAAAREIATVVATTIAVVAAMAGAAACLAACASGEDQAGADVGIDSADEVGGACRAPRLVCDDVCIDPDTSAEHCGGCGRPCDASQTCDGGECVDRCPAAGEEYCGGACVDTGSDEQHCGGCDRGCAEGASCSQGACSCPATESVCDGACVDTLTDTAYCGDCATDCKVDETCVDGDCVPDCVDPAVLCGGVCVDVRNNNDYCGDCDTECAAGETCVDSDCLCASNRRECGGSCVDIATSTAHCGDCDQPCPAGAVCRGGECACPPGRTLCDDQCVDTDVNAAYCGDCDTDCGDELCVDGECADGCPEGETICDGQCVDTDTDPSFCGTCETSCRADQDCLAGDCACPVGTEACDGRCVDTNESELYCGDCETTCGEGETCAGGECGCAEGLTRCGGQCVNTDVSGRYCGDCETSCDALEVCTDGDCVCVEGLDRCGDTCVAIGVDPAHCLGCNQPCQVGQVCSDGTCELDCGGDRVACGGACVDTDTSRQHCGDCDQPCAGFEVCRSGDCACVDDHWEYEFPASDGSFAQSISFPIGTLGDSPHWRNLRLCGDNDDWYSLLLPSPGAALEIYLDGDCLDAIRPRLTLWSADGGTVLDFDEADGSGLCPVIFAEGLDAGWVDLQVENTITGPDASVDGEGTYELFVFPDGFTEVEPNDDPDTSTGPFDADVDVSAEIEAGDDFDTFAVYNERPALVTLATSDGQGSCAVDTVLFVNDAIGTPLGDDDDGGPGACSRLELELPVGLFYVTVFGFDIDDVGAYELAIRYAWLLESEPNDPDAPGGLGVAEGPFSDDFGAEGVIFPAFDRDVYQIELTQPASLRATIGTTGFGCFVDSILTLSDETNGIVLGGDDDYDERSALANQRGTGYCSVIDPFPAAPGEVPDHSFAADLPPGVYTLTVTAFSDRTGPYSLSVEIIE